MANWYYYNKNGEKIGPLSSMVLKELASQGLITPEMKVENSHGRTALAGSVNGLTFAEAKQPEATVYGFEDGLNFPALTSEGPTLTDFDPFANAAPITRQAQPPSASSKLPAALKKPIVSIPLGCLGLFLFFALIGTIATPGTRDASDAGKEEWWDSEIKGRPFSADFFMNEYCANKVSADKRFKDKIMIVEGTIDDIGKDIRDRPYVALKTRQPIYRVQCFFSKKDEETLSSLRKRQQISIKGKCDGALGNVFIKNCSIVVEE